MSTQEFSIGEWVIRRMDGAVGVVKKVEPYEDGHIFYVDLDPHGRSEEDTVWAGYTPAWDRYYSLHAHVSTSSADCDGTYSGGHVYEMTLQERCEEYGDLTFRNRVLGSVVSIHGYGRLDVTPDGIEWREETEEGYRAADVRWCEDDCPEERPWLRDHRAESMGY